MRWEKGDVVLCVEKPGYIGEVTRDNKYVVNDIMVKYGAVYLQVLGDNNSGIWFLSTMFRKVTK